MPDPLDADAFLAACHVDPAVFELRPDYRAMLLVADNLAPAPATGGSDGVVDELVGAAEAHVASLLAASPIEELPHIAAWRETYRAFGAKPQRTRNSLEALARRAEQGLPRINPLTDIYNAISVLHQIPFGGEDVRAYAGPARLVRASGDEPFDTIVNGSAATEHPDPGEVIWRDGAGVTCRRWNWRQGRRTALGDTTDAALFILDALAPITDGALADAADALTGALGELFPTTRITRRLIRP